VKEIVEMWVFYKKFKGKLKDLRSKKGYILKVRPIIDDRFLVYSV